MKEWRRRNSPGGVELHEFSVATGVFHAVKEKLGEIKGVRKLKEVRVLVGELTFLNPEQLKFAWGVLTEQDPLMRGSEMVIERVKPEGKCPNCGWNGPLETEEDPSYHFVTPIFSCPSCGGEIEITRGLEMTVKNIVVDVDEGGGEGG